MLLNGLAQQRAGPMFSGVGEGRSQRGFLYGGWGLKSGRAKSSALVEQLAAIPVGLTPGLGHDLYPVALAGAIGASLRFETMPSIASTARCEPY